jgi:glycosyltransferase involved in cell wall biosynthesis
VLALSRGGHVPEDVFVVRNGPDLATFRPVPAKPALKYGKDYLIGFVGTMSIQEGLDILIEVAENINRRGRCDVHFTCVGGGPGLPKLRQMVEERNLEEIFDFTGRVPLEDLLAVLSTADVCVNPDRPCEMNDISTMIKIMEYMALGKPIVQFDLKEGRNSAAGASLYASKEDTVCDFAAKILWLLEHPEERNKMGELGRKRVESELAWKYSVPHLLAAYKRAFAKRGKEPLPSAQPESVQNYE